MIRIVKAERPLTPDPSPASGRGETPLTTRFLAQDWFEKPINAAQHRDGHSSHADGLFGGWIFFAFAAFAAVIAVNLALHFAPGLAHFPADRASATTAEDLVVFHRAGEMARNGGAALTYDTKALGATLGEHQQNLLWLNPPHALLVMAPMSIVPYGAAKILWMALTLVAFAGLLAIASVRRIDGFALTLFSPAMLIALLLLQLGAFVAVGIVAALLLARDRPILAGVIIAMLTMKPQYGLMVPIFLAATGCWRAIGVAIIVTLLLIGLSILAFGLESWSAFIASLSTVHAPFSQLVLEGTLTLSQTIGKLGGGEALRLAVQAFGAALCAVGVFLAARRLPRKEAVAVTLLLSLVAAPSAWVYDWAFVVGAITLLAARIAKSPLLQVAAGVAMIAPVAPMFGDSMMSGLAAPLALYGFAAMAFAHLMRASTARSSSFETPSLREGSSG